MISLEIKSSILPLDQLVENFHIEIPKIEILTINEGLYTVNLQNTNLIINDKDPFQGVLTLTVSLDINIPYKDEAISHADSRMNNKNIIFNEMLLDEIFLDSDDLEILSTNIEWIDYNHYF
jgi:hypothetical protein